MSKIQSKVHNYGNEKESSWPPRFPKKRNFGRFYWDKETQEFKEGNPPNTNNHFGDAPQVIFDSIDRYHETACRKIESREEWNRVDKETGQLTFSSREEVARHVAKGKKEQEEAVKKDRHQASRASSAVWKSDPRQAKQKLNKQAERQLDTLKRSGINLKDVGITIKD